MSLERLLNLNCNPLEYSAASLAFIGDGVFEIMVREHLVCKGNCPAGKLHKQAVAMVRCEAQAQYAKLLLPLLNKEEEAAFKRGRNHSGARVPQNASVAEYRTATGLEALFGYIYLKGDIPRLRELFSAITQPNE
ncbi:MAG: ribonuclease III [Oscillospiraceae bacterium]|jgi:ribonuclease-3 family protein|nr:ribonuclease III [Oscillospiraceae bacterium]